MHIKTLFVRNFRKIGNQGTKFILQPNMNIVVGENNSGKSSMVDALRLALASGFYKKSIYVNVSDFHINSYGQRSDEINIDIFFEGLTEEQGTTFYLLTDGTDTTKAELHVKYKVYKDSKGNEKVREYITGGPRDNTIEKEAFDAINMIFMPALRDAENDLKPSRSSQLARMLYAFAPTQEEKDRIVSTMFDANESIKQDESIKNLEKTINNNLNLMEKEELNQRVKINLLSPTFESIAGALDAWYLIEHKKVKILKSIWDELILKYNISLIDIQYATNIIDADYISVDIMDLENDDKYENLLSDIVQQRVRSNFTIKQNGLGYNNILSMAALLGDLQKKPSDDEFLIFLVEEPEAHLHPQLLDLLFSFFQKSNSENKIQIILTSHSPTLISKAEVDSLVVLYQSEDELDSSSLSECNLDDDEKSDLKRYLDVTKSQMFFAKRVLFVEGISEALLLTEFANLLGKPFDKYSVEIVNIDGVAFEPYAKLFSTNIQQNNLKYPCAIITDDDRCTMNGDPHQIKNEELIFSSLDVESIKSRLESGQKSSRALSLLSFCSENVDVKLAQKTLEYEMALQLENRNLLLEILEGLHPAICKAIRGSIDAGEPNEHIAIYIWVAIRDCKGIFAQRLAREINKIYTGPRLSTTFKIPEYIEDAINFIIK